MSMNLSNAIGLINNLGGMSAFTQPEKMFYCKIPQEENTFCWGFLSPYDAERLAQCPVKVEVDIPTHQALISGGQIVYFNGELLNSDKYKLNENYDFVLNTDYETEQAQARKTTFENQFFQIPAIENVFVGGWYRKTPKGYASALESLNTAYNNYMAIALINPEAKFPANTLIFYTAPDFTKEEECTEEWLVAHQFRNEEMTREQFLLLYSTFSQAWNATEH